MVTFSTTIMVKRLWVMGLEESMTRSIKKKDPGIAAPKSDDTNKLLTVMTILYHQKT